MDLENARLQRKCYQDLRKLSEDWSSSKFDDVLTEAKERSERVDKLETYNASLIQQSNEFISSSKKKLELRNDNRILYKRLMDMEQENTEEKITRNECVKPLAFEYVNTEWLYGGGRHSQTYLHRLEDQKKRILKEHPFLTSIEHLLLSVLDVNVASEQRLSNLEKEIMIDHYCTNNFGWQNVDALRLNKSKLAKILMVAELGETGEIRGYLKDFDPARHGHHKIPPTQRSAFQEDLNEERKKREKVEEDLDGCMAKLANLEKENKELKEVIKNLSAATGEYNDNVTALLAGLDI